MSQAKKCCIVDKGERCPRSAGPTTFTKRAKRGIATREIDLRQANAVRLLYFCVSAKGPERQRGRERERRRGRRV